MSATALDNPSLLHRLRRVDFFLLACVGLIICMSIVFISSAARGLDASGASGYAMRQALFICMGFTIMVGLQKIDYLALLRFSPFLYAFGLMLLVGVFFTRPVNGARSWYNLYLFKFQPSELMKPIIVLTLAHYLMYRDSYKKLHGLLLPLGLAMLPMVLILKQPDLGTFLAFAPVVFVMLFAAGARIRHLAFATGCGALGMIIMWFTVIKEYQKRRVLAWLDPEKYRLDEAWQLLRSETAIGSGGFWGKGWGQAGHDSVSAFPERHTDFIFAVVSEEGGFVFAALLMLLVFLTAVSGLGIAARTREPAGRLIAVGCVTMFCSQVLINTGVALGLLPTTGLTFPFLSYGGSSILSSFICLGLLISIGARQEPVLAKEDFA